jgi:hypothetical protein
MKNYVIAFIVAMVASSAITDVHTPAKIGTMVAEFVPTSHGTIHDEEGIGEIQVNEAARMWRYIDSVTTKHPNRRGDAPFYGNN